MATQERICADCGAINHVGADACWRCLERLARTSAEPASTAEPTPQARPAIA